MNNTITYKQLTSVVQVYLDGRRVGTIRKSTQTIYRYFPKSGIGGGDPYETIEEVKKSLEKV